MTELWYRLIDSIAVIGLKAERIDGLRRIWRGVSPVHCWEDGPDITHGDGDYLGSTCMRWQHHRGSHQWTPDGQIGVSFR